MTGRGRPSRNRDLIVHSLVKGLEREGVIEYKLTRRDICTASGLVYESSVQAPLTQLVNDGIVATELVNKRTREPPIDGEPGPNVTVYFIDKSKWRWLLRHYFPTHGASFPDRAAARRRAEFLSSDFSDEIFQPERFYEIVTRAFLKWCIMMDGDSLRDIQRLLTSTATQQTLREHLRKSHSSIDDESVSAAFILLGQLFQQLYDLKTSQRMPTDSFFEALERPEVMANSKRAVHFLLGMREEELRELASFARLSPSLLSYVLQEDVSEGMPPVFLFDLSKLKQMIAGHPRLDELWKEVRREFSAFFWRLLFVMVTRDMIDYPETMTMKLLKKAGLYSKPADRELSLEYLVEKVARQFIPTTRSLRNRLVDGCK